MVARTPECRFGRAAPLAGATCALLALAVAAAPPLGYRTAPAARPLADPVGGGGTTGGTTDPGGETTGGTDIRNEPGYVECTAEAPIRLAPNVCVNRATVDALDNGWNLTVNPDGTYAWTPPPTYDPATGGWGSFDGASQTCDPNIQVKLQQAALAGSQLARAISDRQLAYSQTDPIEAVKRH